MVAFHQAVMCATAGDWKRSHDLFRRAITLKPDFPEAHHALGVALWYDGKKPQAAVAIREAIRLKPDFAEAYLDLGCALDDNSPEEIAAYREAIRLKPDYLPAYGNLGNALWKTGRLVETVAVYREAARRGPAVPEMQYNLGSVLDEAGEFDEAVAAYQTAIRIKPDYAEAYYNLGVAFEGRCRLPEALAAYRQAVAVRPNWPEALCNLGEILAKTGQKVEAIPVFAKALDSAQNDEIRQAITDFAVAALNAPVGESKAAGYNVGIVTDVAAEFHAVADDALKSGVPLAEFRDAIKKLAAKAGTTARETTGRATAKPRPKLIRRKVVVTTTAALPPLPKGLKWPKEHFDQSPYFQKHGGIVRHLDEVWRRHIEAGVVDMAVLRAFYPSTALGVDRLRKRRDLETGERLRLPPDLDIPQVSPGSGRRPAARQPQAALG
jgi:tetratricopeptide (TPR) repeat protein